MIITKPQTRLSTTEFVVLASVLMSLTALAIDAMLPALGQLSADLGVTNDNDRQLVVSLVLFGLSFGQVIFGTISDSTGRKPAIIASLALYMAGALLCMGAVSFPMLLAGRFIQGLGASGPRAVTMALVRDQYVADEMARIMSFIMTVFILVPMIAPSIGQGVLLFAGWRAIFGLFVVMAAVGMLWLGLRQPETLPPADRVPFTARKITEMFGQVLRTRSALGYTVTAGLAIGGLIGYVNSAQQVFQEQYQVGALFPLYFGAAAGAVGVASLANTWLVGRFGMRALVRNALYMMAALGAAAVVFTLLTAEQPPLWLLMAYIMLTFLCVGIVNGNVNALAMEPLGRVAGVGSAVVGSFSTLISAIIGTVIGQAYNGTLLPLLIGFALMAVLSILLVWWAEAGSEVPPV